MEHHLDSFLRLERDLTNRFLSKINRTVNVPDPPFTYKQLEACRYFAQYDGADAVYIPPDLTLDDFGKLGKIDAGVFSFVNTLFKQRTTGRWVMMLYEPIKETVGQPRQAAYRFMHTMVEKLGGKRIDFGFLLDHLYVKLFLKAQLGFRYPKETLIWMNDFKVFKHGADYLALGHSERQGLYVMRYEDVGASYLGASPICYFDCIP